MYKWYPLTIIPMALVAGLLFSTTSIGADRKATTAFEEVTLKLKNGIESKAVFFNGKSRQAVVFLRTMRSAKESWFPLAGELQQSGIASLAVDGGTSQDVASAIDMLNAKGFDKIALAGGSAAARSILNRLEEHMDVRVNKVIVFAPMGGARVQSDAIDKLIIVGKDDPMGLHSYMLYDGSSAPKLLKEYDTGLHALELFKGEHRKDLMRLFIDFIKK